MGRIGLAPRERYRKFHKTHVKRPPSDQGLDPPLSTCSVQLQYSVWVGVVEAWPTGVSGGDGDALYGLEVADRADSGCGSDRVRVYGL